MICNNCKHWRKVSWRHGKDILGCNKAIERHGTDGYGPWYSHAACKHDPDQTALKDLYEPIQEDDKRHIIVQNENLNEEIHKLKHEIDNLERTIVKLSKTNPAD